MLHCPPLSLDSHSAACHILSQHLHALLRRRLVGQLESVEGVLWDSVTHAVLGEARGALFKHNACAECAYVTHCFP